MNGPASASDESQSLLKLPTSDDAGNASVSGAGSTTASDNEQQSIPQDSHPSINQNPPATNSANTFPDESSAQNSLTLSVDNPASALDEEGTQTTPLVPDAHDKGNGADSDNVQHEHMVIKEEGEVLSEHVNGHIELLDNTPDQGVGSSQAGYVADEAQDWMTDADHELKRVKVYELIGSRWMDRGTAFCFGQFSEETQEAFLIARSERQYDQVILTTAIRANDVYQRQQDTLIVWTEPDGVDYALSFQDPEGCAEVWNFIQEVRHHMNSSESLLPGPSAPSPLIPLDTSVTAAAIVRSGHLPVPQLGIISEIERAIKSLARTQNVKERICEYIQNEDYIKSLINVMHTAEDLESLENLHALCSLMQTILMLNDHTMYEHILEDDIFFGVVGMLEYDPDFPGHKANYRDFLHNTAQFHQPIPMRDISIQRKIHHTYRLQFLKDVVLARAPDDSTLNVLNSCIIFNQIDIIGHIQQDPSFLRDIVRLFVDEDMLTGGGSTARRNGQNQPQPVQPQPPSQPEQNSLTPPQQIVISLDENGENSCKVDNLPMDVDQKPTSPKFANGSSPTPAINGRGNKRSNTYAFAPPENLTEEDILLRREVVLLLQQLCVMGKNVHMPTRIALFRSLVDRGILFAVQWAINLPEKEDANKQMINAGGEVLSALLEHDINGVRAHVLKQVLAIDKEREAGKKGADKAETILHMACRIMAQSKDLAVQSQVGDALKTWLDIPSGDGPGIAGASEANSKLLNIRKDEPGVERFMDYFYKECIHVLFKPLSDLPEWRNFKEPVLTLTREETNRFVYLCDLTHNCIQQHHFRSHIHFMASDILSRVATLFRARDKHLRHSAFRIFRLLLKQGKPNSYTQIMKHDILKPILDLTIQESLRDNLLSCSCQEYFDQIRRDNIKELIKFCMTRHEAEIQQLAQSPLGGQRFQQFIRRWEMNIAPPPEESPSEKPVDEREWRHAGRGQDLDEESYFQGDDDEDIVPSRSQAPLPRSLSPVSPLPANNTGMKRKRRPGLTSAQKGYRPPLKSPILSALVDYGEDDDENESATVGGAAPEASTSGAAYQVDTKTSSPQLSNHTLSPSLPSTPSGPPPKRLKDNDEEDNLLEALARYPLMRSKSPSPVLGPMRPSEKRRRADDDDDELLVRLSQSKKPDLGSKKDGGLSMTSSINNPSKSKGADDLSSKKIKVKLGAIGLAVASSPSTPDPPTTSTTTPTPVSYSTSSEPGKKDGDTG